MTVGELKKMLRLYPDNFEVSFSPLNCPKDGTIIYPDFFRLNDRGGICSFEWNPTHLMSDEPAESEGSNDPDPDVYMIPEDEHGYYPVPDFCPRCGGAEFKDKGSWEKCLKCDLRLIPGG